MQTHRLTSDRQTDRQTDRHTQRQTHLGEEPWVIG